MVSIVFRRMPKRMTLRLPGRAEGPRVLGFIAIQQRTKFSSATILPRLTSCEYNIIRTPCFFQARNLETEAEYHPIADATLEAIQDAVDDLLDSETNIEYEVSLSSGVLTIKLGSHGTFVINKQTPNKQLWWSSPLSGPKRFEYDDKDELWFSTKDGLNLGRTFAEEIHHLYPSLAKLELEV